MKSIFYLKTLLFSYILTGSLLLLLALLLYKLGLSETIVSICIVGIYIVACFFLGFVTGKKEQNRKFLWGFLMGCAYFCILLVMSLAVTRSFEDVGKDLFSTFLICAGSGMLGGMLG